MSARKDLEKQVVLSAQRMVSSSRSRMSAISGTWRPCIDRRIQCARSRMSREWVALSWSMSRLYSSGCFCICSIPEKSGICFGLAIVATQVVGANWRRQHAGASSLSFTSVVERPSALRRCPSGGRGYRREFSSWLAWSIEDSRSRLRGLLAIQISRRHPAPSAGARWGSHHRRGSCLRHTRTSACPYSRRRRAGLAR